MAHFLILSVALLATSLQAKAEVLEIETESGVSVTAVEVDKTNSATGQTTEVTVSATDQTAGSDESVNEDAQIANVPVTRNNCLVDLTVKTADGQSNEVPNVDVCGLETLVIEEPVIEVPQVTAEGTGTETGAVETSLPN
jgi:hypothetical protein